MYVATTVFFIHNSKIESPCFVDIYGNSWQDMVLSVRLSNRYSLVQGILLAS